MLIKLLVVGAGGFLGAILRYLISLWLLPASEQANLPLGTFVANMLGCFLIGLLSGLILAKGTFSPEMRLLLLTGFLGALTTFSTFALETSAFLRFENYFFAALNVLASLTFGLGALWLGNWLSRQLS